MLRAEPPCPVPSLERFELVSSGDGIEQDEVGNGCIELAERLGDDTAEGWAGEPWAVWVSSLQKADCLKMLGLSGFHIPDDVQSVRD